MKFNNQILRMLPWVRDKINERKLRWQFFKRKDDNSNSSTPLNSPVKTSKKSEVQTESDGTAETDITLRIISPRGGIITVKINPDLTGLELKTSALKIFSEDQHALAHFAADVAQLVLKHKLIRSKTKQIFNDIDVLKDKNVINNEEFLLVVKRTDTQTLHDKNDIKGPTSSEVLEATKHINQTNTSPPICNVTNILLPTDLQYDLNKILISLAKASAYIIGGGPYAERVVLMFQQRIINEKRVKLDATECLVEMGFNRKLAEEALEMKNNIFLAALDILIQNKDENKDTISAHDYAVRKSENINKLLAIIETYCQKDVPPQADIVHAIIDMGFDEADVREALKVTRNNKAAACEWLLGERNRSLTELRNGLPLDSAILQVFLSSPQVQISLSNPKMLIALISMLDNYTSIQMWLSDSDISPILEHILRTYHEEKCIIAINQFNCNLP